MRHRCFARLVLPLIALVPLAGCGSEGFVLAPVSGRVTVDGQPVAGLRVAFEPIGGPSRPAPGPEAVAITEEDGRYSLSTMSESPRRGAVVGKCRVRIWTLPSSQLDAVAARRREALSNDRDPNYDPVKEIQVLKQELRGRGRKKADQPTGALPLRYNDQTQLSFEVPPEGTDRADFSISWK